MSSKFVHLYSNSYKIVEYRYSVTVFYLMLTSFWLISYNALDFLFVYIYSRVRPVSAHVRYVQHGHEMLQLEILCD